MERLQGHGAGGVVVVVSPLLIVGLFSQHRARRTGWRPKNLALAADATGGQPCRC